ncbi:glutathione S-transferase family protein [Plectonema cf. radiosum LEGE 06105]|uniref:Glutathione S-transferase family protein n=1 Tax=Plectonema cf. radiosum LEGE 06105 TaxID=945769 RepID=A0A8J7K3M8_9CYAN|nr:glutathione S-transferase family protein [Plectonema radiosum]MBE9214332.1 glutathione S-transferase family protein [Plectonema cf. radiosum LEGE 06105]
MLKLYGGARSRASIIQWYLEELEIPYEFVKLDMQAGEHLQPEFLAINPMGKVPAITDGDFQLWESGAILLYLADKYSKKTLSPEERAIYSQWSLFANATLGPGVFLEANREKEMPRLINPLNEILAEQPFLMGQEFTVADVAVGSILNYIPIMLKLDLSEYPNVTNYMTKLSQRPAFQKAMGIFS